jgi:bifunctional non-homologous end joining protein LigD
MLASPGSVPAEAGWALEVKWDGIRAQLRFDDRRVCVRSRPGRDCTAEFPELAAIAEALDSRRVILDGELVCLDGEGRPISRRCGPGSAARLADALAAARRRR